MIDRPGALRRLQQLLSRHPVVAILGARQVGKTTLARAFAKSQGKPATFFDLERDQDVARLADPELALRGLRGIVVLDEIQRRPELFPALRVLADRARKPARFLVLGSASPDLLRQSSESLAGRIAHLELPGLALDEVGAERHDRLWLRGGFPRAFTARSEADSREWRGEFVRTFLERDIGQMGIGIPPRTLHRFWSMLAHYHGQTWNASEFARAFGVSSHTTREYLEALEGTFMVRSLPPWFANISKRQVKSPKVYVRDSGILHTLLDVPDKRALEGHPKIGASWEGFLLEQVIARLGARREQCFYWATHTGAELDLLVTDGKRRLGFEFKRTSAPKVTPSMRSALTDLELTSLDVIHAGTDTFPLSPEIRAVAADDLLDEITPLKR